MARIIANVPIADIYFDEELYPRNQWDWQTTYNYQQNMVAGAVFPIITLALLNQKKYLVDGKHRLEANKNLKRESIQAEVFTGWSREKIFIEAVKRNIAHGRILTPYEKRLIALKLKEMKFSKEDISKVIQVPMDKLDNFVAQRLINSITGETIKEVIIKKELSHLAGRSFSPAEMGNLSQVQKEFTGNSQLILIEEIIALIENKAIDTQNEQVTKRLQYLKSLI